MAEEIAPTWLRVLVARTSRLGRASAVGERGEVPRRMTEEYKEDSPPGRILLAPEQVIGPFFQGPEALGEMTGQTLAQRDLPEDAGEFHLCQVLVFPGESPRLSQ